MLHTPRLTLKLSNLLREIYFFPPQVKALTQGWDRPVELGYKIALELKTEMNRSTTPH